MTGNVPKSYTLTDFAGPDFYHLAPEKAFQAESAFHQTLDDGTAIQIFYPFPGNLISVEAIKKAHTPTGSECKPLCLLIPHHNLAMIVDSDFDRIRGGRAKLRKLGYIDIRRTHPPIEYQYLSGEEWKSELLTPFSPDWNSINYTKILRALRSKHPSLHSIDSRAQEILRLLAESRESARLPLEAFNFGVFLPHPVPDLLQGPVSEYDVFPEEIDELGLRPTEQVTEIPVQNLKSGLENLCKGLKLNRAIGLSSLVRTRDGPRHIPMIDLTETDENHVCYRISSALDQLSNTNFEAMVRRSPGFVVISGRSYHFYSQCLLTEFQWKNYMHTLANLPEDSGVDTLWAKVQLAQGYSLLRITPSTNRMTQPCFLQDW